MSLTLLMIRCPDAVAPERREVFGGEFNIGRGPDNDWVLADPDRILSKRHCQLAFRSGQWQLADLSSNGTFVNNASNSGAPVGQGSARTLRSGDRISFGAYEIEVGIQERDHFDSAPERPAASSRTKPAYDGLAPDMLDPFAEPAPARPFGAADPLLRDTPDPGQGVRLPPDFDPLGVEDDPFRGPTQSDHAPAIDQAFRPAPMAVSAIPDDWDIDLPPAPARPPAPAVKAPVQAPVARPQPPAAALFDEDEPAPIRPAPIRPAPVAPVPAPPSVAPAASAAPESELVAAFLRGTGLGETVLPDPAKTMELAGAAMRATVSGIRQALIARASIKGEFRIEQTMIRSSGNNPLKFSAGDDDAMAAFLGVGRRNAMLPAAAVTEALRDMRLHELATVTAMQAAVRALLAQFDPVAIDAHADKGGLAKLPGQRKARAWDAFETMHARVSAALSDDFESVFGKAFARAYEQALRELSTPGDTV